MDAEQNGGPDGCDPSDDQSGLEAFVDDGDGDRGLVHNNGPDDFGHSEDLPALQVVAIHSSCARFAAPRNAPRRATWRIGYDAAWSLPPSGIDGLYSATRASTLTAFAPLWWRGVPT